MNDVCGKEYFPPLGKNRLRSHFTIQDFITGKVDALTFIETFTHEVALQAHKTMHEDLVQNVPLCRFEDNLKCVWKPQSIFHHFEENCYVPTDIDTGQVLSSSDVPDEVKRAMGASDFSKTVEQQRKAKYTAYTGTEASTVFWNGLLPEFRTSQAAANFYLEHVHGLNIDDDAQNLPLYDVTGNKLTSTHSLSSSSTYKDNGMNLRVAKDDLCVYGKFLTRPTVRARAGAGDIKEKRIAMESPSLYVEKSMAVEPPDMLAHEYGI